MRRLADLERELRELRAADPIRTAGMQVTGPGALTLAGDVDVTGDMDVTGAMSIMGPLTLNPGSIPNDALLNPLEPGGGSTTATGFGLTTTPTTVVSYSVPIPAGFTKCVATGIGSIFVANPSPNPDYLYARTYIDAPPSQSWWGIRPNSLIGPNNGSAALTPVRSVVLTGLTPGSVTFRVMAFTAFAAWADPANIVGVEGTCLFFR